MNGEDNLSTPFYIRKKLKRKHENDAKATNEIVKFTKIPTRRLIDLSIDCLSEVFRYLNISDLVILAKANLTDNKDLDRAFTPNSSSVTHPYEAAVRDRFKQLGYADCVTNNPDCILFEKTAFRLFGTLIPKVGIYYDPSYCRHNAKIEQVIMESGSGLTEIGFYNADSSTFKDIEQPYVNVTKLQFHNGWLGPTFFELNKWFPNLNSLSLRNTKIFNRKFVKQEHRHLIKLSVWNRCYCRDASLSSVATSYVLNNSDLKQFLRLNSQIQYLSLQQDRVPKNSSIKINFDFLRFIGNTLRQLCYLKLNIVEMSTLHVPPTYLTTFPTLRTLIVEAVTTEQLSQLNIMSDEVNRLEITMSAPFFQDDAMLSLFVVGFKNIEYLSIGLNPVTLNNNFALMMSRLTKLRTLRISIFQYRFLDDLCFVIQKFSFLHTVRINCFEVPSKDREIFIKAINARLSLIGNHWFGTCTDNDFEFKNILFGH